ncbi:DUF5683 domain-containing protein [Chitinivibrio alkaliphilus]|uniref:DUF5683 domain-containing protein n=1 Tax=Chitinivibrio alkaliphilus ACht1 TaxID=1313304 RepID=U7D4U7_9BACT|nr:DUF5683 domain-containing protein [Chitinivibrio alkaliphilus]ERP31539.1 hypothetical protein CALK_1584 [Chitinivibrio alkaliphilus ACht1]
MSPKRYLLFLILLPLFINAEPVGNRDAQADTLNESIDDSLTEEEMRLIRREFRIEEQAAETEDETPSTEEEEVQEEAQEEVEEQQRGPGGPSGGPIGAMGGPGAQRRTRDDSEEDPSSDTTEKQASEELSPQQRRSRTATETEDERVVSFSENIEEYRSPQRAMLYSLALPGLGQAYVERNWKVAAYGAVEIALIAGAIKFSRDSDDERDRAHAYLDEHFEEDDVRTFYANLEELGEFQGDVDLYEYLNVAGLGYGDVESFDELWESFKRDPYDRDFGVANPLMIQGWDGATEVRIADGDVTYEGAEAYDIIYYRPEGENRLEAPFGTASTQQRYLSMLDKSQDYSDYSTTFVIGILVNHVVSATDAFISARRHNRRLLSAQRRPAEDERLFDAVHLTSSMYRNVHGGLTTEAGVAWRF